jgi:hypothetical protein
MEIKQASRRHHLGLRLTPDLITKLHITANIDGVLSEPGDHFLDGPPRRRYLVLDLLGPRWATNASTFISVLEMPRLSALAFSARPAGFGSRSERMIAVACGAGCISGKRYLTKSRLRGRTRTYNLRINSHTQIVRPVRVGVA